MIKISVVIPCFNVANYIEDTLRSVWNQSGTADVEIILVDDCSTDNTFQILQELQRESPLIVVRNEQNRGVSFTRNRGIELASGEIILFLDGDDIYQPGLFESLTNQFSAHPNLDMMAFGYLKETANEDQVFLAPQLHLKTFSNQEFLKQFLTRQVKQCMCSFAVRRAMLIEHQIQFDEATFSGEDQEFEMRCILKSREIVYVSEIFFVYKHRNSSFMNHRFQPRRLTSLSIYSRMEQQMQSEQLLSLSKYLNTYFALEFFSVLKYCCQGGDATMISQALAFKKVVYKKGYFNFDKQSMVVGVLKGIFRLHTKSLIYLLKK